MPAQPWVVVPLKLPVGDKEYVVEPVSYDDGLTLIKVNTGESKKITTKSEDIVFFRLCMGSTWDEMQADRCSYPVMFRAGLAAVQYQSALVNGLDSEAAVEIGERIWNSGIDPERLAALVAATDFSLKTSTPSTNTGTARKTPSRASTKATNSRKGTPPTKSSRKAGSTGRRSSSSGPSSPRTSPPNTA